MIQTNLVNTNLGMRKGKISAQVGHGVTLYMDDVHSPLHNFMKERNREWIDNGMHKIVLRSNENEMYNTIEELNNLGIMCYVVRDFGSTQVPEDSFTVLAVEPLGKKKHEELFSRFKLL